MWDTVVVMGVSGCGKSTVGEEVAKREGIRFVEGDKLHTKENIDKMRAGIPLTDADRLPWLHAIRKEMDNPRGSCVVSCSALKKDYRSILSKNDPGCLFVHLDVDRSELLSRLTSRPGHFFPASLLDSQLSTLQPLDPSSSSSLVIHVTPSLTVKDTVDIIERHLHSS